MARFSRWSVGMLVVGSIIGLGVSALGAPEDDLSDALRPAADRGRDEVMALLSRKERALERRMATLDAREADLRAAETQVETRLVELQSLRDGIRLLLTDLDADREKRVTHLVKMFESMRAPQAADILTVTEDTIALEVLERMNRSKAGKTLAAMPPERAAYLAERIGDAALRKELLQ
jgi:flagellar motility protein MotE (MotC chaperone)